MAVKRIFNINNTKARSCLKCGHLIPKEALTQISDNKTGVCPNCGQANFVDINGNRCSLTVTEHPELRRKVDKLETTLEQTQALKIKELEDKLAAARKRANEWEKAAEGLARMVENLKEEKRVSSI